jgi:DNA repair exonuclease SbcCD ATPase subunit
MRILSLEIKNIRGIKYIKMEPNGENVVVYGPNGTGKSAIVDSIDFLLTGKISRLTGEGSKDLALKEHGCHVDSRDDLKNTAVTAKVLIENKEVVLERRINRPASLKVEPKEFKDIVDNCLKLTDLGQHILTRRDILMYITAEAGKRAKKIMSLLDLDEIENIRSAFVALKNEAEYECATLETNLKVAESDISALLEMETFSEELSLTKVNALRQTLNGTKISSLSMETIKKGLTPQPFVTAQNLLTPNEIKSTISEIRSIVAEKAKIKTEESELRVLLEEIEKDKVLRKCLLYKTLVETGLLLLDDSNVCPLCGREWSGTGDLAQYLRQKENETKLARQKQETISRKASNINLKLNLLENDINKCATAHKQFEIATIDEIELDQYLSALNSWAQATSITTVETYDIEKMPSSDIDDLLSSTLLETKLIAPLETTLEKIGASFSTQQLAWDTLTRMEEKWKTYIQTKEQKSNIEIFKNRANSALDNFEKARNSVLESIYDAVRGSFDEYYKIIHGQDEDKFSSDISHEGAELKFEVDFYQRGKFPPHALHSEGHQDSMGLSLFFALNRYLVKEAIAIMVLDDVVMSIDSGHRRGVCELLKNFAADRQLIITTHDSAWAKQLRTQGIVKRKNMIHFENWNINDGPVYELEKDLFDLIAEDLKKDQLPVAAARLRRNVEHFFDDVCDSLGATLRYKGIHQWELGDYAPAAISAYKRYLKRAKTNAQAVGDEEKFRALDQLDKKSSEVFSKTQIEQWIVNENVHYNKWEQFSKEDFLPMVSAYKELFNLFSCSKCGSLIAFSEIIGEKPRAQVSCTCGNIFWNVSE